MPLDSRKREQRFKNDAQQKRNQKTPINRTDSQPDEEVKTNSINGETNGTTGHNGTNIISNGLEVSFF